MIQYIFLPVYKEYGRLDAEYNMECSMTGYQTLSDAWASFIDDCETDADIVDVIQRIASGEYSVKKIKVKHPIIFKE